MTAGQLITYLGNFPADAEVSVMAMDWYPKQQMPISNIIDANGATTPTTPLLIYYAGPDFYANYDASGYQTLKNA